MSLVDYGPYGKWESGTEVEVVTTLFGGFAHTVGMGIKNGVIGAGFNDPSGSKWYVSGTPGSWSIEAWTDDDTYPGPYGVPWNTTEHGFIVDETNSYYQTFNPYTGTTVNLNIGRVTPLAFPEGFLAEKFTDIDWPDDPFAVTSTNAAGITTTVYYGNILARFLVATEGSSTSAGITAVSVYYHDVYVGGTNPYTRRDYSVATRSQSQDLTVYLPVSSTYWNGPGSPPGSEGIFMRRTESSIVLPYTLGGTRFTYSDTYSNTDPYSSYLIDSDWEGVYDFNNLGFSQPYSALTWAFNGSGNNVVHGVDSNETVFSKYMSWGGSCYRAVRTGKLSFSPSWIWACAEFPRTIFMPVGTSIIAVTVPGPRALDAEPCSASQGVYPDTPFTTLDAANPPLAKEDTRGVYRW